MTATTEKATVTDRAGTEHGTATGTETPCQMEGCRGRRIWTRWPDGSLTKPCTRGMSAVEGGWRITE